MLAVERELTVMFKVTGIPIQLLAEVSVTLSIKVPIEFQLITIWLVLAGSGIIMVPPPDKLQL